mmetsp:Transcript_12773/g.22267  ORF Transcript_12773/g.22267 Transcript_12773/m.22267 type:complete len:520 (-) Transcript_12773:282-1841(-)
MASLFPRIIWSCCYCCCFVWLCTVSLAFQTHPLSVPRQLARTKGQHPFYRQRHASKSSSGFPSRSTRARPIQDSPLMEDFPSKPYLSRDVPTGSESNGRKDPSPLFHQTQYRIGALRARIKSITFWWISYVSRFQQWLAITSGKCSRWIRRLAVGVAFFVMVHCTVLPTGAEAAGSSGRMGGSFGSSNRNGSPTRVVPRASTSHRHHHYRSSHHNHYSSPKIRNYRTYSRPIQILKPYYAPTRPRVIVHQDGTTTIVPGKDIPYLTPVHYVLITGAAAGIFYKFIRPNMDMDAWTGRIGEDDDDVDDSSTWSPLGPGVSVMSLTVCLNVPDRSDPDSILHRLHHIAQTSNTGTREGVQELLAETALELARQEKSIISVESQYERMKSAVQAQRRYLRISVQQRSKFYRENLSNYGGRQQQSTRTATDSDSDSDLSSSSSPPTVALVSIHLSIEGNSLRRFDKIKTRKTLKEALAQISSDAQVDDCLLAAEVIWSPEDPTEQMTMEDIYADFPTLVTLLD